MVCVCVFAFWRVELMLHDAYAQAFIAKIDKRVLVARKPTADPLDN